MPHCCSWIRAPIGFHYFSMRDTGGAGMAQPNCFNLRCDRSMYIHVPQSLEMIDLLSWSCFVRFLQHMDRQNELGRREGFLTAPWNILKPSVRHGLEDPTSRSMFLANLRFPDWYPIVCVCVEHLNRCKTFNPYCHSRGTQHFTGTVSNEATSEMGYPAWPTGRTCNFRIFRQMATG